MKIRSNITFNSLDLSQGEVQVNVELRIKTCAFMDGYIDNSTQRGVAEIIVEYIQVDASGTETVLPASNHIDNRIVLSLQDLQTYVLGLDEMLFDGLYGYPRIEAQCYYFLLPYITSINLLGTSNPADWSIVE